jgi:hypothetical protein
MARPKKEENDKATESFVVRLNKEEYKILDVYASSLKIVPSSAVTKILSERGCFEYDINDDLYLKIMKFPEAGQIVPRIRDKDSVREIKIVRCWVTKREKKSLAYYALVKHNVSPSVLVNSFLKNFLANINQEPEKVENNADVLVKDLWQHISNEVKKELVDKYLQETK